MPTTPTAGEQTLASFRAHWHTLLILVPVLAAAATLQAVLVSQPQLPGEVAMLVAAGMWAVVAGFCLVVVLRWLTTAYALTDRRVLRTCGILRRQSLEIPLTEIASIKGSQTLVERLLRYGDITVETAGDSDQQLVDIPRPNRFKAQLSQARDQASRHTSPDAGTHATDASTAPPAGCRLDGTTSRPDPRPRTRADRWDILSRLGPLVESGVLTPQQFDRAMHDLLDT